MVKKYVIIAWWKFDVRISELKVTEDNFLFFKITLFNKVFISHEVNCNLHILGDSEKEYGI